MLKNYFSTLYISHGQYFLLVCLLLILSPYFYLSLFAHPIADDYCYATLGKTTDLISEWLHQYFTWNGRYSSNIFVLLNPLVFNNFFAYKAFSSLQILLFLFSIYYFLRAIFGQSLSPLVTLNASILLLLIYLFQMPSLSEGIYWFTGAVSYQTGISLSLFYFGSLINYFDKRYRINKAFHFMSTVVLLICISGFNEVLTLIIVCFHLFLLLKLWQKRRSVLPEWIVLSGFSLICFLFMVFAPGNNVRDSYFKDNHTIIPSIVFTGMQIVRFSFEWISPLLMGSYILTSWVVSLDNEKSFFHQKNFFDLRTSILLLVLILFLCIFPPYWGTNILGQHRTVNVACFFFILFWFFAVGMYAAQYAEKIKQTFFINKKIKFLVLVVLLGTIAVTKNGYSICTDILYSKVNTFDLEMQARYTNLSDPENKNRTVAIQELNEKPSSLFVLELSSDPAYWVNHCQANYFGVKGIVCKK